jgi:hypothetical protein
MINAFRKARFRLLGKNLPNWLSSKLSKYMLYAIGEIILVVLGILIALGINNSNEIRKNADKERIYLESLFQELKTDSISYEDTKAMLSRIEKSGRQVLDYIESPQTLREDSLTFLNNIRSMIATDQKLPEPIVWKELQSTGNLRLIQNRELIELLFKHYRKVASCQADYISNAHPFIIEGRYFDSKTFSIEDQDDYFDNWKKDKLPSSDVFKSFLEDRKFYEIAKGIVTGMIISKLVLSAVIKNSNEALHALRTELQ